MDTEVWNTILGLQKFIFARFNPEAVPVFEFLVKRAKSNGVKEDHVFQFMFRSFYRMNGVGLSNEFKIAYFEIFEKTKRRKQINLEQIARSLKGIKNVKEQESLQFSFITKMANCLDQDFPIYDRRVRNVFGLKYHPSSLRFEERLRLYLDDYSRITNEYKNAIQERRITQMSGRFRKKFHVPKLITNKRILDFIVWTYAAEN